MDSVLEAGLSCLGINPAALPLLVKYMDEIELFNPAYGLVGTKDRRELIVRHILDSLAPLKTISRLLEGRPPLAADAGSGAGLPGIPLALVLPELHITLIERMGRRAGFLRNTQAALGLANVSVEEAETEKAKAGRFSLVVFRAFRPLDEKTLKSLFRLCAPGGALAAYKGRRDAIEKEMAPFREGNPRSGIPAALSWEITACPVPFLDEERHIVILKLSEQLP
jgi:16S rRNA (guanine527-N7)-methyltransferase